MRILLLAMPDTASSLDRVMKFPNLGTRRTRSEAAAGSRGEAGPETRGLRRLSAGAA